MLHSISREKLIDFPKKDRSKKLCVFQIFHLCTIFNGFCVSKNFWELRSFFCLFFILALSLFSSASSAALPDFAVSEDASFAPRNVALLCIIVQWESDPNQGISPKIENFHTFWKTLKLYLLNINQARFSENSLKKILTLSARVVPREPVPGVSTEFVAARKPPPAFLPRAQERLLTSVGPQVSLHQGELE